jgi:hypothetical protein
MNRALYALSWFLLAAIVGAALVLIASGYVPLVLLAGGYVP